MNLVEALTLAKATGAMVRPKCWNDWRNPVPWLEYLYPVGRRPVLVECGSWTGLPHSPRLDDDRELLGEWEVVNG